MNRHPISLRGGQMCFLRVFHAILRQIWKHCFCAISSRELSLCDIFYAFSNCDGQYRLRPTCLDFCVITKPSFVVLDLKKVIAVYTSSQSLKNVFCSLKSRRQDLPQNIGFNLRNLQSSAPLGPHAFSRLLGLLHLFPLCYK